MTKHDAVFEFVRTRRENIIRDAIMDLIRADNIETRDGCRIGFVHGLADYVKAEFPSLEGKLRDAVVQQADYDVISGIIETTLANGFHVPEYEIADIESKRVPVRRVLVDGIGIYGDELEFSLSDLISRVPPHMLDKAMLYVEIKDIGGDPSLGVDVIVWEPETDAELLARLRMKAEHEAALKIHIDQDERAEYERLKAKFEGKA